MTTMIAPTAAPTVVVGSVAPFKLDVTRRAYYVDAMTGERVGVLLRNWEIVG